MCDSKIKRTIVLIISLFMVISLFSGCNSSVSDKEIYSYLDKNHENININNPSNDFSIFSKDADKNSVILCGEAHAVKYNYELELQLIEYFNRKYNVKYILAELPYSTSCYINNYLETGDEENLKSIFYNLQNTASYNNDLYDFWVKLRKYNLTLSQDKKIKVVGVDIEHQLPTAVEYLNYIISNSGTASNRISPQINNFKEHVLDTYLVNTDILNNKDLKNNILKFQKSMSENRNYYKKYLGSKYFDFNFIVNNMANAVNSYSNYSSPKKFSEIREKSIYNNFKILYSHLPRKKYFGQFGMEHVYQKGFDDKVYDNADKRFAMYLNCNDSPVRGKVLSVAYAYRNCYEMSFSKPYFMEKLNSGIEGKDYKLVNKYAKSDITIFKLDGSDSPFSKALYLITNRESKGVTTDYYKYIVLIMNSPKINKYNIGTTN